MVKNKKCILRLSSYRLTLLRLKSMGFVKVFSDNLADAIGVTPSQVRKDFSQFGISGFKRGGYLIDALIEKLNLILGKDKAQNVIVVGAGLLGSAIIKYNGFEKEGIKIAATFDNDSEKIASNSEVPVLPVSQLKDFIQRNGIRIGIIAVPDVSAQQVFKVMQSAGIKGVLNFAPTHLLAPEECIVNNINIAMELDNVIYFVKDAENIKEQ